MKKICLTILVIITLTPFLFAQQYVNVTFRHYPTQTNVRRAFVPGTFNNWGPNNSGAIATDAPSRMSYGDSLGFYYKTYRFVFGSSQQYKFYEQYDPSGTQGQWFTDPLNPLVNTGDHDNSILNVKKAMIFEILPKTGAIVNTKQLEITAGVFSRETDPILLDQSTIYLDDVLAATFEGNYISDISVLHLTLPEISKGEHVLKINLHTQQGETATDSVSFNIIAGDIIFFSPSCDSVFAPQKTLHWQINMSGRTLTSAVLRQLDMYPLTFRPTPNTEYSQNVSLFPGLNRYVVSVTDNAGVTTNSDTLKLYYIQSKKPEPRIIIERTGNKVRLSGSGNDPQGESVSFVWSNQSMNPIQISGVNGNTNATVEFDMPNIPGDYSFKLEATDATGHVNSTINFITISPDSTLIIPELTTAPQWVKDARIYCIFFKAFTRDGTILSAIDSLNHIKNMGFNTIWVLPVMDVEGNIDQGANIGYNIIDFYNVDPNYGTNEDFKQFVQAAHELGMRVILDVTPNHSSRSHPIALDARSKRKFSRYYDFFQHEEIAHDTNGLGQCTSKDGIIYYCGFSDALVNWNWSDSEARQYMLDVYTYWLREYDIDGYRLDVYWGPHRRYGRQYFDQPLRAALRGAKADIMILAETQGTGAGTEVIYADQDGGADLGYDWILKDAIWNYPSISTLNSKLYNAGYRPGENSFFMRFLENHDEDRVAYRYDSFEKTIPVSTAIFMATGIPLLFQGQEVGMGLGMSGSKDDRARATINWENPPGRVLAPHYQKLAQIRAQFPAFRRQFEDTNCDGSINSSDKNMQQMLNASSSAIYAFGRPWPDQNGLVVMNFGSVAGDFEINLNLENWAEFTEPLSDDRNYFVNNLYQQTSQQITGANLDKLNIFLNPYQVAVFTISRQEEYVELPTIFVDVEREKKIEQPAHYALLNNFPNPFNPSTTISYQLPKPAHVKILIYNLMGQKIRALVNSKQAAGNYQIKWDGLTDGGFSAASGIYFYKLETENFVECKKMILKR